MENILTDGHYLSTYICKGCIVFKQFDGLNFDGLAGKHQKHQNFPHQNFALYGIPIANQMVKCKMLKESNQLKSFSYSYTHKRVSYISP